MSDLIRSSVESNGEKIIKYQVQDNTNNDKIIRHQVMGIGGGSEPVLESLSVTENGTYTPTSGVDGFNNVDVNVPSSLPDLELISQIKVGDDGESVVDTVRGITLSSGWADTYCRNLTIANNKITLGSDSRILTKIGLVDWSPFLIEIDIDNCDNASLGDSRGWVLVDCSPRMGGTSALLFDNRSSGNDYSFYSAGSSGTGQPRNAMPINIFDNKTLQIRYNNYYDNNDSKWYINGPGINWNMYKVYIKDDPTTELVNWGRGGDWDYSQVLTIGRTGSSLPFTFTEIRVYKLNNLTIKED